jgi:small multidrug resistance family-3 protein
MPTLVWYALAAFAEIGGCFAFWSYFRLTKSYVWLLPGLILLAFFAFALTRVDTALAGRAFAAYAGVYVVAWSVEKMRPDRWDILGAVMCIAGTLITLYGPRRP